MIHDEHTHDHDHDHDHHHHHEHGCEGCEGCGGHHHHGDEDGAFSEEQAVITMVDAETGEEYQFALVDDFAFKGNSYCVLVTIDDEEPELVITKVSEVDGEEVLMSLEESEEDEVYSEYDRLCEESELLDEDDTES